MSKLKLKPEFEGMIITRKHFVVGEITFNANQVPEDKYSNYQKSGFEDLFYIETIEDTTTTEKVVLTEDKPVKKVTKKSNKK